MGKLIVIMMLLICAVSLNAQTKIDTTNCNYVELQSLGLTDKNVVVVWGYDVPNTLLKEQTMLDGLNYMASKNWELTLIYESTKGGLLYHFVLKRKKN